MLLSFSIARDLNVQNPDGSFGNPNLELHGLSGDGIVTSGDVEVNNLLITFSGIPGSTSVLDVTSFLQKEFENEVSFAEFSIRVSGIEIH